MYEDQYKEYRIPKRKGGFRIIREPGPQLKAEQKKILRWLQARGIKASYYAYGFIKGRSTVKHARLHSGRKVIMKLDIEDFFGTTNSSMLRSALRKEKLPEDYIRKIIETCTYNNVLPQGAPTSPFLSNIALKDMDLRLAGLAQKHEAVYSRYADDICLSSDNTRLNRVLCAVKYVVNCCGYNLNETKTQILRPHNRQIITGIVVNEKANIPRKLIRRSRARLHNLKIGLLENLSFDKDEFNKLKGMASYFNEVRSELGIRFRKELRELETLLKLKNKILLS